MPNSELVYTKLVDTRPWGKFTQYAHNQKVTVKIIEVCPNGKLSVQRHRYRDELWVMLSPNLRTTIDGVEKTSKVGDELWISRGTVHTIENPHTQGGSFLEISFGEFDEQDIERLEDKYGRL